jgi:hypothetical protein
MTILQVILLSIYRSGKGKHQVERPTLFQVLSEREILKNEKRKVPRTQIKIRTTSTGKKQYPHSPVKSGPYPYDCPSSSLLFSRLKRRGNV